MSLRPTTLFVWAVLLTAVFPCSTASAQTMGETGGLVITTSPPGAVVELAGDYVLSGVTPWRLHRGLEGVYELRASKIGYEIARARTVLSATRVDSIHVRLTRKTKAGAGLRSAVVPGWGQFYGDQPGKGTLFFVAGAVAVGGFLWADANRSDAEDEYAAARGVYSEAEQIEEIEDAYDEVLRTFDEFDEWHTRRKYWIYAAGAVWAASILDALVLQDPGGASFADLASRDESGLYAHVAPDRITAGVAFRF